MEKSKSKTVVPGYEIIKTVGEGTYGKVFKATELSSGDTVAIKNIKLMDDNDEEGVPATTLREVSLLQELRHPNIVNLRQITSEDFKIYLVFDYIENDLHNFIHY